MSVKKIVVPEGMREVFHKAENHDGYKWDDAVLDHMLEAALRWMLSGEPATIQSEFACEGLLFDKASGIPVILHDSAIKVCDSVNAKITGAYRMGVDEGLNAFRKMFLAPEPEVPLSLVGLFCLAPEVEFSAEEYNTAIMEAYRRGQQSK